MNSFTHNLLYIFKILPFDIPGPTVTHKYRLRTAPPEYICNVSHGVPTLCFNGIVNLYNYIIENALGSRLLTIEENV